jgi:hypothetical protein
MSKQNHNPESSFKAKRPGKAQIGSFDGTFKQGTNARPTPADYPSFGGNAGGGKDNGKMN